MVQNCADIKCPPGSRRVGLVTPLCECQKINSAGNTTGQTIPEATTYQPSLSEMIDNAISTAKDIFTPKPKVSIPSKKQSSIIPQVFAEEEEETVKKETETKTQTPSIIHNPVEFVQESWWDFIKSDRPIMVILIIVVFLIIYLITK